MTVFQDFKMWGKIKNGQSQNHQTFAQFKEIVRPISLSRIKYADFSIENNYNDVLIKIIHSLASPPDPGCYYATSPTKYCLLSKAQSSDKLSE